MEKQRAINIRVEEQLFRRFSALVSLNGTTIAAVLRGYMERYVDENAYLFATEAKTRGEEVK